MTFYGLPFGRSDATRLIEPFDRKFSAIEGCYAADVRRTSSGRDPFEYQSKPLADGLGQNPAMIVPHPIAGQPVELLVDLDYRIAELPASDRECREAEGHLLRPPAMPTDGVRRQSVGPLARRRCGEIGPRPGAARGHLGIGNDKAGLIIFRDGGDVNGEHAMQHDEISIVSARTIRA